MIVGHAKLTTHNNNCEPIELQKLKRQLANLNCICSVCKRSKNYAKCAIKSVDKEVQYEQGKTPFLSARELPITFTGNMYNYYYNSAHAERLIPGVNMVRVEKFKYEGSETTENFHCDKSTGHTISFSEKSTSIRNKQHPKYSNLTLCEFISVCSSCSVDSSDYEENYKPRRQEKVKFLNNQNKESDVYKIPIYNGDCLYLDNLIDSIRPPL